MTPDPNHRRHCGQVDEFTVDSEDNFFRVSFRSNDRLDGTGFEASYMFYSEDYGELQQHLEEEDIDGQEPNVVTARGPSAGVSKCQREYFLLEFLAFISTNLYWDLVINYKYCGNIITFANKKLILKNFALSELDFFLVFTSIQTSTFFYSSYFRMSTRNDRQLARLDAIRNLAPPPPPR